ncbi:beta-propeller domain-containing protein [Pendulispora rubella]|uniref:Beta-propeller domain-containing protein n=1 Tax=Pendulispora rubella TaxID=2741070 RepID=A0ABZ2L829_9BACT
MARVQFGWALGMGCAVVVSCAPSGHAPPGASGVAAPAEVAIAKVEPPAVATATAPPSRFVHRPRPPVPQRPPPPVVMAAMAGEPSPATSRLESASCAKAASEDREARVQAMRAEVDRAFGQWRRNKESCQARRYSKRSSLEMDAPEPPRSVPVPTTAMPKPLSEGHASMAIDAAAPQGTGAPKQEAPAKAGRASGTNNQVAGVDEADIVKNDGRYVYFAANGALRIAEALQPRIVSVTPLSGVARNLFVEGDHAVVYSSNAPANRPCTYGYDCAFAGDGTKTTITVYDVADRTAPKIVRQIDLSGSLMAARRIGNAVHTVVADGDSLAPSYATWPEDLGSCDEISEKVAEAKFWKLKLANERKLREQPPTFPTMRDHGTEQPICKEGLLRTRVHDGGAFTTVVSFDLQNDKSAPTTAMVKSRPGAVFASESGLYLSVTHQKSSYDEVSEIHKFRIGGNPHDTKYLGSGVVPGHVLNQFAMDEWAGYLRIATTRGRVPDPKVQSTVSILREGGGHNLARVGAIGKIAPGEDIRAVRFDGDRAYVVTFKKTDPLFVLDLYHPAHPAILGELKIPGFSTYIHRIDPEHLLSIGFDANDHGSFAYFDGVILQLFDVKNPTDPKLVHKEKIGTRGSSSEAATDHLAFNYFAEQGLLAVPMTVCEGGGDGMQGNEVSFSGLLVYDVDIDKGFTRLGGVNHAGSHMGCSTWWSNASSAVKRSIFLDDLVYSIASDRAKVQHLGRLGVDVADLPLSP